MFFEKIIHKIPGFSHNAAKQKAKECSPLLGFLLFSLSQDGISVTFVFFCDQTRRNIPNAVSIIWTAGTLIQTPSTPQIDGSTSKAIRHNKIGSP